MDIRPNLLSLIFVDPSNWHINYSFPTVKILWQEKIVNLPLENITGTKVTKGLIWSTIELHSINGNYRFKGIFNSQAENFHRILKEDINFIKNRKIAEQVKQRLCTVILNFNNFMNQYIYFSNKYTNNYKVQLASEAKKDIEIIESLIKRCPRDFGFPDSLQNNFEDLKEFIYEPIESNSIIKDRNNYFINHELIKYKGFFDHIETTPLTQEQRVSSIIFEDRNLLVAAAGSGKTSTIVGKIGYALLNDLYKPEEILVLAFNNDASQELNERINSRLNKILKNGQQIEAFTFHKLGQEIIAEATGKKPSISDHAKKPELCINKIIENLIKTDIDFRSKYYLFKTAYISDPLSPFNFKTSKEWEKAEKKSFDRYKDGFTTYQGETVKSHGEKAIANWLFSQGIPYKYEAPYKYITADRQYSQYHPDFYLPDIDLYIEHYALDQNGNPPIHFGQKYLEGMKWKEKTHNEYQTNFISTTFHEFITGTIFKKLENELKSRGQKFSPKTPEEINNQARTIYELDPNNLYITFLNHFKSNQFNINSFLERNDLTNRQYLFVSLFSKIYEKYNEVLKSESKIDFNDLIIQSTELIKKNKYKSPYKFILIDEFQDISQARAKLVLALLHQIPDAKLFCVGDDWQAIYRFAGSDISIFKNFENVFGFTKQTQLTQTFRSNQGIADVASYFIQKNKSQLQKAVTAIDKTKDKIIEIHYCKNNDETHEEIYQILNILNKNNNLKHSVFILSRYNRYKPDMDFIKSSFRNCKVEFKTIHSSKGLQADYVILMGLNKGNYAFPSEREDDPLLNLVLPVPEPFALAEERRLFYVALTRAKKKVFLIGEQNSIFLEELINDHNLSNYIHIFKNDFLNLEKNIPCPQCKKGQKIKRNGPHSLFWGCTTFPKCSFIDVIEWYKK